MIFSDEFDNTHRCHGVLRISRPYNKTIKFKVGDIVRRKNGTDHQVVYDILPNGYVAARYIKSNNDYYKLTGQKPEHLVLVKSNSTETEEETQMANTLYKVTKDGQETYAIKMAVDTDGKWVMKNESNGTYFAVDKKDAEEVLPHTIGVKFQDNGIQYSYFSEKGKFKVGEFYIVVSNQGAADYTLAQVVAVDTKSKKATKEFIPLVRVVTEPVDTE